MKRPYVTVLSTLTAIVLFSGISSSALADNLHTAGSDESRASFEPGVVFSETISLAEAGAVERYWTPERTASTKPLPLEAPSFLQPTPSTTDSSSPTGPTGPTGPTVTIAPAKPTVAASSNGSPASVAPFTEAQRTATAVPRPYTDYPDVLNGKVFFTDALGHGGSCSGTLVNSENKSIIWTAGHCVHEGRNGDFYSQLVFVPAYSSQFPNERPYGVWVARNLWTTTEWAENGNFRQDFGLLVLNQRDGQRIGDLLGGQGITFNKPRNQSFSAFGYPAQRPFDGFSQWRCDSRSLRFPSQLLAPGAGPQTLGISCDMTPGSSGGGWLVSLDTQGLGFVNGLVSHGSRALPGYLFSPYHGNEALSLYNEVRDAPA